jgi:hypothetical protein
MTNIAVDILRSDFYRPKRKVLLYFIAVSITAVATAAITYALIGQFGFQSKSLPPVSVDVPPQSKMVEPLPPSPEPVPKSQDEISQIPPKIQIPSESKYPLAPLSEEKATQNLIPKKVDLVYKNSKETIEKPIISPPSLTLSAIAWSEEPSKRIAMVNDTIVREGSKILGVKVLEIFPHRVRFFYNGQTFEISISQ